MREPVRVIHGPVIADGLAARVVEVGGVRSVEVWCGHGWDATVLAQPPLAEVLAGSPADPAVLDSSGVPADPLPPGYEPGSSCCLCVGEPAFRIGGSGRTNRRS
jgi:hypothetical protein